MPRFVVNMTTDNAAFQDDPREIPRILRAIAQQIEDGRDYSMFQTILDANGNDVGRYAEKPDSYFDD